MAGPGCEGRQGGGCTAAEGPPKPLCASLPPTPRRPWPPQPLPPPACPRSFLGLDPEAGRAKLHHVNTREQHLIQRGELTKGEEVRAWVNDIALMPAACTQSA